MRTDDVDDEERRLAEIYRRHAPDVAAYALRRASRADAADAVAETFLIVWRRRADLPDDALLLPWLYAVARRVLANQRRSNARRSQLAERLVSRLVEHEVPPPSLDKLEELEEVTRALNRLPPADAELVRLAAWESLNPSEIAAVLGISPEQTRRRLYRARQRLRKELARQGNSPTTVAPSDRRNRSVGGPAGGARPAPLGPQWHRGAP